MCQLAGYFGTASKRVDGTGNELQLPNAAQDRPANPRGDINAVGVNKALVVGKRTPKSDSSVSCRYKIPLPRADAYPIQVTEQSRWTGRPIMAGGG